MKLGSISHTYKALAVVGVLTLLMFFIGGRWFRSKVIDGDVISYYAYLPAAIVHGDLKMRYSSGNDYYADKVWGVIWKDDCGPVQKYTMGLSWIYAPFFLLGHASAYLLGYTPDGYTPPYNFWIQFSSVAYLLLGLWWLRKVLLRFFGEGVSAICLLVLPLGTNLYYYTLGQGPMPHVYLFALVSGLLWATIRFYEKPNWRNALAMAVLCSVITLVRPTLILMWGLPVLYGIVDGATLKARIAFWRMHWVLLLILPLVQLLTFLPQLWYWHLLTDHWLYYSYGDEHFFWTNPVVGKVFFSFRNGWLIYSPLMALGLLGMLLLRRKVREFAFVVPLIIVASTYVISCWWCWWYGGSFGGRAFIDFYPLLGLGMGAFLSKIADLQWSQLQQRLGLAVLGFFILLNQFQTFQFSKTLIHYDSMTAAAYVRGIGLTGVPDGFEAYLETPDYEAAKRGER